MMIALFLFESSGGVGALSLEVLVVCDSEGSAISCRSGCDAANVTKKVDGADGDPRFCDACICIAECDLNPRIIPGLILNTRMHRRM